MIDRFSSQLEAIVRHLEHYASLETPSRDKAAVDRLGEALRLHCETLHAEVTRFSQQAAGDVLLARWNAGAGGTPILLIGHMDTVWPVGTLASMPVRREGSRLYGPGVQDMKGGIVLALAAIEGLQALGQMPDRPLWLMLTPDEEIGSPSSRAIIEETAARAGLVLVMEPPGKGGALKTQRKGIASYQVRALGRASHVGNAPEEGINAVLDIAHQAIRISALNDPEHNLSVHVTQVSGGVAGNVIPPQADLHVDVRFLDLDAALRLEAAVKGLVPVVPGVTLEVTGRISRPPMIRDARMEAAFTQAAHIAGGLGMTLQEVAVGGGSDGNFAAALGIPTLDGLGAVGGGMHTYEEFVEMPALAARAALIAALLRDWQF